MKFNVIACGKRYNFNELTRSICISLQELGHTIELVQYSTETKNVKLSDNNFYIGFALGPHRPKIDMSKFNIYYCTEQYMINPTKDMSRLFIEIRERFDIILDMFKVNITTPKYGKSIYCPIGYSKIYEDDYDNKIKEEYDIFHFGSLSLSHRNRYSDNRLIKSSICFGKERNIIMQQSKMNLSLNSYPNYEWTQYRMMLNLGRRRFLITEPHVDYGPYKPNKHFIVFDNITECFNRWADNDTKRKEFAVAAYKDLKENHSMTMYLEKALNGVV